MIKGLSLQTLFMMDLQHAFHSNILLQSGFVAQVIRPPPMKCHYYGDLLSPLGKYAIVNNSLPTLCSKSVSKNSMLFAGNENEASDKSADFLKAKPFADVSPQPRIAIIGGGISGVTAANALSKKLTSNNIAAKIVVFEGDKKGSYNEVNFSNKEQPSWTAATARNANTICPGASMHVMSQRKTLIKIMKDTSREWFGEKLEMMQSWMPKNGAADRLLRLDNFDHPPPYFALHLFRCLGPSATWEERFTFVNFLASFLRTSLFSTEHDVEQRGKLLHQIAKSNRALLLEEMNGSDGLASKTGLSRGFVSLYRSKQDALHDFHEAVDSYGEDFSLLSYEEATKLEPRIQNLPINTELYAVHRKTDYTADCAMFIKDLTNKITREYGVEYKSGLQGEVRDMRAVQCALEERNQVIGIKSKATALATDPLTSEQRFTIRTKDGRSHDFDFVVLAAGVNTPLFARMLSIGDSCPTYPLRGYSLTIYSDELRSEATGSKSSTNLLNQPLKIDDMYCSSVGANMARIAGFGELVGYRDKAVEVPSLAPKVLSRYGKKLFPESNIKEANAMQCFRPQSPDDIPIVGAVRSVPGVFLHTGHGTLGWTLCLATSECLATALTDEISGIEDQNMFHLPGGISVERDRISPNRFT